MLLQMRGGFHFSEAHEVLNPCVQFQVGVGIATENRITIFGFVLRYDKRYTAHLNNMCACGRGIFSEPTLFNIKGHLNVILA